MKINRQDKTQTTAYYTNPSQMESIKLQQQTTELNVKITALLASMRTQSVELLKYLEEMPVTIPDEKNPLINVPLLKAYYKSLQDIQSNYNNAQEIKSDTP